MSAHEGSVPASPLDRARVLVRCFHFFPPADNASSNNKLAVPLKTPESTGTEGDLVRVATFNINNLNKRLDNLLAWLARAEPDVVSLQELRQSREHFP